jgi:hypothetical protein
MDRLSFAVSPRRAFLIALCTVGLIQVFWGAIGVSLSLAGVVEFSVEGPGPAPWQFAVQLAAYTGLAIFLLQGARRDVRLEHLGGLLLVVATFFAYDAIETLVRAAPEWGPALKTVRSVPTGAFVSLLVWLLLRDFPRAPETPRVARFVSLALWVSATVAIVLTLDRFLSANPIDQGDPAGLFWPIVFAPMLPAPVFVAWRTLRAPADERRRIALLTAGLVAGGSLPVLVAILSLPLEDFFREGGTLSRVILGANQVSFLLMPLATTYSVVVDHALPLRTVLRKTAQYWLARLVVVGLAAVPFLLAIGVLYRGRSESITELFSGPRLIQLLAYVGLGLLVLQVRQRVMLAVDRLFFRESYSAPRVLATVTDRARGSESLDLLAEVFVEEVDRALHVESIGVLVGDTDSRNYIPLTGRVRRLGEDSSLVSRLRERSAPLAVDIQDDWLGSADRLWVADADVEALVPLIGGSGSLSGILAVGPKRSELPLSRQDFLLLEALGGSVGTFLENQVGRESGAGSFGGASAEARSTECVDCGHIEGPDSSECSECAGELRACALPRYLFDKFELERRIGSGAMGVVYRATDLALERTVALKTLPATSPEEAARLRKEARAMARITHPNLALILGVETWQGTPVLVLEYLAGGTLEQRIHEGALDLSVALGVAHRMAMVLERSHTGGILHRDVKPSNIGFTDEGEPKLLDFGMVRIAPHPSITRPPLFSYSTETGLAGTPLYMSPEALRGGRAETGFDLWSLTVVLFECISGKHPFERATAATTLAAIQSGWTPEQQELLPSHPPLADLFSTALARERTRRPATARDLAHLIDLAREEQAAA